MILVKLLLTSDKCTAGCFSSIMGLFGNKELQFKATNIKANHAQGQSNKGRNSSFVNLGGALVNTKSIGGN